MDDGWRGGTHDVARLALHHLSQAPMTTSDLAVSLAVRDRREMRSIMKRIRPHIESVESSIGPTGFVNYVWRIRDERHPCSAQCQ